MQKKSIRAMTLMEMLIVTALVSVVGLALYQALCNGIQIWERANRLVVEEDIAIFFDKMSQDLRNSYGYSKINFEGNESQFAFPTVVWTEGDSRTRLTKEDFHDQLGQVEYFFDFSRKGLYKRQANYGQALNKQFGTPQLLVKSIDGLKFSYYYTRQRGQVFTDHVLNVPPAGLQVEVEFSDKLGRRLMRKFIDLPVGG